jgi:2-polyprenyl-6-methoxyphenol hydroxylase-like FAD-dependent oxidoreductase
MHDCEVLIVGGGPVGLALAIELGLRGVRTTLLEQSARHSPQPRAKTTNVRSMEHFRRWGIADRLRESAPLPAGYGTDVIFATRLFGHTLARFGNSFFGDRRLKDDRFAEPAQWVPQYKVEAALRARAAELPSVTLRLGTRLDALAQAADGVTATAMELASGAIATVRARYVVGADGARSPVRGMIGARMEGEHAYAQHVNLVIRAPALAEAMRRQPAIMYWVVNAESSGVTGPMDSDDTWFFMFGLPNGERVPDEANLKARMNAAFGRQVPCDILVVDPWSAHSLIADRYRDRRVVLAGDACHLHPPFGGYGMNLGLGDAVDLGWKLAATVQGWGGAELLDSYEAERRPVHRRVIDEAVANHALLPKDLVRAGLEADDAAGEAVRAEVGAMILAGKEREFRTLGVVLGSRYDGSPIIVSDGSAAPEEHPTRFVPSAHPGCRAPHAWLRDGRSLFDLWEQGFTLLVAEPGRESEALPMVAAARGAGVPFEVVAPGDARLADLYGARFALIRPDGHVAWRGARMGDAVAILDRARGAQRTTGTERAA